jgi:iron complex transport system substrate-binding protein
VLAATAGAIGAAALGGCTGSPEVTPSGSASRVPEAGFPREVRHELGTTVLRARPRRIVAATDGAELAALLALGVKPVGFGQRNQPLRPWIRAHGGDGVPTYRLVGSEKTSFERLAAWRPDLLLVQKGFASEENYPRYSAVAPTVVTSFIDWRASLRTVADALGRSDDADRLLRRTEELTASTREKLAPHAGTRLRVFSAFPGEILVLNADSPLGKLAPAVGLAPFPPATKRAEAVNPLSFERLGELDADLLLVQHFDARDRYADVAKHPGFRRLPVVAGGRVVQLTQDESHASYFDSVLTVPLNLALLERHVGQLRR